MAEPTRLRLLNCLAAGPLFVTDLQAVLDIPQPTVSRHLSVLRHSGVVEGESLGSYVLYRLRPGPAVIATLLEAVLTALDTDPVFHRERRRATTRARSRATTHRATA